MLAKRIIPSILCRGPLQVKGVGFDSWRAVGVAEAAVRIHSARGCDEILLVDIGATPERRGPDLAMIERISAGCFCPLTVGGGVRTLGDIEALLRVGADKVLIGAAAIEDPRLIHDAAVRFGSSTVVVAVDVLDQRAVINCGKTIVRRRPNAYSALMERAGAGEILLTSVVRDGTLTGYDLDLIAEIADIVNIPVIAAGGCGTYDHMRQAFLAGADACASGAMLQWTDATPRGAAEYLSKHDVEVRL